MIRDPKFSASTVPPEVLIETRFDILLIASQATMLCSPRAVKILTVLADHNYFAPISADHYRVHVRPEFLDWPWSTDFSAQVKLLI